MKLLKDNQIGCYTCSRWRTGSPLCNYCTGWNRWQGVEQVNKKLESKGLQTYIDAEEMRVFNLSGPAKALRYRARKMRGD